MYLLTHERYKTYQTGFSFGGLGHALGVGLGGTVGVGGGGSKKFFFTKFNQIWCVSLFHELHTHWHHFLGPRPLGPWGGAKRSNIIKSELQSQFQRFLNQTLCIFSQTKDIKLIRWDFHSGPWVMPRGGTWEYRGGGGGQFFFFQKINQISCVSSSHEWHMHRHNFWVPAPWGLGEGLKN